MRNFPKMRAVAVSVWIFINLVFVGMCGYIYLLWTQYWQYVSRHQLGIITYSQYRGETGPKPAVKNSTHVSHSNDTITVIRHSQPRFPKLHQMEDGSKKPCNQSCMDALAASLPHTKLQASVAAYKSQLVVQLRRVLLQESSIFAHDKNVYNVQYTGPRGSMMEGGKDLMCEIKKRIRLRTLNSDDDPFKRLDIGKYFPKVPIFSAKHYNTCAIVTNAGSLYKSQLGKNIDTHDVVLRFNHAPTKGYEVDVGRKTTIRIVNSQVVSKPKFDFLNSPMYQNVTLLAWDPSNYSSTLEEWYSHPDFDLFTTYFHHRVLYPNQPFYILDPRTQWTLWDFIQGHIPVRIRKNPPSSGFLGLVLMLPHCNYVDLFEYIPSMRLTKRCHYFDVLDDAGCTFGTWHPLAAEKLLSLQLNIVSDETVFGEGYVRIPGFDKIDC